MNLELASELRLARLSMTSDLASKKYICHEDESKALIEIMFTNRQNTNRGQQTHRIERLEKAPSSLNSWRDFGIGLLINFPLYIVAFIIGKSYEIDIKISKLIFYYTLVFYIICKYCLPNIKNWMILFASTIAFVTSVQWACIFGVLSGIFYDFYRGGYSDHRYDKAIIYLGFKADYTSWVGFFPGFILSTVIALIFVIKVQFAKRGDE